MYRRPRVGDRVCRYGDILGTVEKVQTLNNTLWVFVRWDIRKDCLKRVNAHAVDWLCQYCGLPHSDHAAHGKCLYGPWRYEGYVVA